MPNLEKYIQEFIKSHPSSHYFVACSGGVDSMVLLYVLYKLGVKVSALHVNYHLRAEDSEKDQELIEEVCKEYTIPCHVKSVHLQEHLDEFGGNLQEEARKVRYAFFEEYKPKAGSKIALAHHSDDQTETFFLNIARGSGIMGLACMLPENNGYLRPLLPFSKDEIISYAKSNFVIWREDVSNAGNKYRRNKLRNVILPELKDVIPTLQESVLFLVNKFQESQKELEIQIEPLTKSILETNEISFKQFDSMDTFGLMELLRQLEIPLSMHPEFVKLRNSEKGKRIEIPTNRIEEVIHEESSFYFSEKKKDSQIPALKIEIVSDLPVLFSKDILYLDPAKIKGELQIRYWKAGDRMRPVGVKGSKLISDILKDAKVPNHVREEQLVVHDEEKIVWCVGYAIGNVIADGLEIMKVSLMQANIALCN